MARIRPYESQVSSQGALPGRNAQLADVGGPGLIQVGQAVQQFGADVGQMQRLIAENDSRNAVSDVHTMLSGARALYTQKSQEFINQADPSDTQLWQHFYTGGNEETPAEGSMKWYLDSYREKIQDAQALRTFDQGAAALTADFAAHYVQQQARMAGVHAQQQAIKTINNWQTTVQTDPSQYTKVIEEMQLWINSKRNANGRLDAGGREKIERMATEQIASSTVRGMIGDSPQHALNSLERGEWDAQITGEQKIVLMRSAETAINAIGIQQRQAEAEEHRRRKDLSDATEQKFMAKYGLHMADGKHPPLTALEVAQAMEPFPDGTPGSLDGTTGRAILNMLDADAQRGPRAPKTDYRQMWALFERISLPAGDPRKLTDMEPITQLAIAGGLEPQHMKFLRDEFIGARTEEGARLSEARATFLKMWQPSIDTSILGKKLDQTGAIRFGEFTILTKQEEDRMRKENKNPYDLYNPKSPEYLGNKASNYILTPLEAIKQHAESLKKAPGLPKMEQGGIPEPLKRLPGETIDQYDKRTGR